MVIPFPTTDEQIKEVPGMAKEMVMAGLPRDFVAITAALACWDQGVWDLMMIWLVSNDWHRSLVVGDIQKSLKDYGLQDWYGKNKAD